SIELRKAFANVMSAGIAKRMSEGLAHGIKQGKAGRGLELESLKDAPMEVNMASLHLESDFGEDAPKWIRDLRLSTSQLKILVYLEVHDPRDPWAVKDEMLLEEGIAANVSEKKKRCRMVCRTYGIGSAHHARSDGVPALVPTRVYVILLANLNLSVALHRCVRHPLLQCDMLAFLSLLRTWRSSSTEFLFSSPRQALIPSLKLWKSTSLVESDIQTNATMADDRTMAQMLQAHIEGYEDAIVVPPINANNFELKQTLINLVRSTQFTGRQDPHNHLRFFNKVTSTFRHLEVPNTTVKLVINVRANANANISSSQSNSFDLQQIAAALEDKLGNFEAYTTANDANMNNLQLKFDNFQRNQQDFQKKFEQNQDDVQNQMMQFMQNLYNKPSTSSSSLPSNTIPNPKGEAKAITTRSGMSYKEPPILRTGVNQQKPVKVTNDTEPQNSDDIHPPTVQAEVQVDNPADEPVVVMPKAKPNLPYPSRLQKEKIKRRMTF
nr:reverse transcriptase domain-containing protein [Tanacetum cinerariifolium]